MDSTTKKSNGNARIVASKPERLVSVGRALPVAGKPGAARDPSKAAANNVQSTGLKLDPALPPKKKAVAAPHSLAVKQPPKKNISRKQVPADRDYRSSTTPQVSGPVDNDLKQVAVSSEAATSANDDVELPPPPLSRELRSIDIRHLIDTLKPIVEHPVRPYTPLILDRSRRVGTFFQYSSDFDGIFIPAKKFLLQTLVQKTMTMQEALETLRGTLVTAMKYGRTLVIDMADSATDFLHKFTSDTEFPSAIVLAECGRKIAREEHWSRVVREEDKEKGVFVVREGFKVIITSVFELEDYEDFLKSAIPMDEMIPIHIQAPAGDTDASDI
ncbi:hypothetical protein PhCBS80983_g02304 [Powellomyces hirtus]|uniref:Uncharacterized protein n=1 Tax=Powellomyces hirtus TaxID=109895 RepID=A0A507E8R8_9FUNG|nr:hypothetical protein PhCBS80983_g02304 [Powellomyces hirtus]